MKYGRAEALVAAALTMGLVVGGVASVGAAPMRETQQTTTVERLGLRLGTAVRDAGGRLADVVADLTGQETEAVIEQRQAGVSYADIAEKADVSTEAVVDQALDVRREMLESRVAAGTITEEQSEAALDRMKTRITERVEATDNSCDGTPDADGTGGAARRGARRAAAPATTEGTGGTTDTQATAPRGAGRGARDGSGGGSGSGQRLQDGSGCGGACVAEPAAEAPAVEQ